MAFQNAFVRVSLRQSSTTSVTGNVANMVIALMALVWLGPWTRGEAAKRRRS